MPSVDVVVPSYQYARYLRTCVSSVLAQEGVELRVLIIDNASTDGSAEIARQLASEDSRIEVVARARNLGPHASFNDGIDWARADYFLILCADDLLAPGALSRGASIMDRHSDVHLTYGATMKIASSDAAPNLDSHSGDADWTLVHGRALLERFCRTGRNHIPGPTAIVRTCVQKKVGHYRKHLQHTDDLEVWMRFACLGNAAETEAVQGLARTHSSNQSSTVGNILLWDREYLAAFESFFSHEGASLPDAARLMRMARRGLSSRAYWCALSHLCRREPMVSLELFKFAVKHCPEMAIVPPIDGLVRRPDGFSRVRKAFAEALLLSR